MDVSSVTELGAPLTGVPERGHQQGELQTWKSVTTKRLELLERVKGIEPSS